MRRILLLSTLAVMGASVLPVPARALETTEQEKKFFLQLQSAVNTKDKTFIADQVNYPLDVFIGSKWFRIEKKEQFVANYDQIITPYVVNAMKTANVQSVQSTYSGVSVAGGAMWFQGYYPENGKTEQYAINRINTVSDDEYKASRKTATAPTPPAAPQGGTGAGALAP